MRVSLPSGGYADIVDLTRLRARHRQAVQQHMGSGTTIDESGNLDRSRLFTVAAAVDVFLVELLVEAWELPYAPGALPPEKDPDWLDVLDIDDMAALEEAVAPHRGKLLNRRTGRTPEVNEATGQPVADSPTAPAGVPAPSSAGETSAPQDAPSTPAGT